MHFNILCYNTECLLKVLGTYGARCIRTEWNNEKKILSHFLVNPSEKIIPFMLQNEWENEMIIKVSLIQTARPF